MKSNRIVSQDVWLAAERRSLPWLRVEKRYTFETEQGSKTLAYKKRMGWRFEWVSS